MHVVHKDNCSPFQTPHGEVIREMVGRFVSQPTELHSVAHVSIPPGAASLLHYHPEAEESYYILRGEARVLIDDEEAVLSAGQIVLIPPPKPHKIESAGEETLELLVVCAPAWEPTNTVWLEGPEAGG